MPRAAWLPLGDRSIIGSLPQLGFHSTSPREAVPIIEEATLLIALLERRRGIESADAIGGVPRIDAPLIGTNDLCLEMVDPGGFNHRGAVDAIVRGWKEPRKFAGIVGVYHPIYCADMLAAECA